MHLVAVGGSDAGISAALRARELDPGSDVAVVVADAYPNFSICGIPYYISGEVTHWRNLAHRSYADLEATGMRLRLATNSAKPQPRSATATPPKPPSRHQLVNPRHLTGPPGPGRQCRDPRWTCCLRAEHRGRSTFHQSGAQSHSLAVGPGNLVTADE
jgi:hypothetical protein